MNNIPKYSEKDPISWVPKIIVNSAFIDQEHSNIEAHPLDEIQCFRLFLNKLIMEGEVDKDTELDIINLILNKGTEVLSENQKQVLNKIIKRTEKACSVCNKEFTYEELSYIEGNLCSSC